MVHIKLVSFKRGRKGDVVGFALPSEGKVLFPKGFSPKEESLELCEVHEPEGKPFGFAYPALDIQPDRTTEHLASVSAGRPPYAMVSGAVAYLPQAEPSTRPVHIRVEWFGNIGIGVVVGDPLADVEKARKEALAIERRLQDVAARLKVTFLERSLELAKRKGELSTRIEQTVGAEPLDRSEDVFDRAPTGRWRPFVCEREVIEAGSALYRKIHNDAERVARRYLRSSKVRAAMRNVQDMRAWALRHENRVKQSLGC